MSLWTAGREELPMESPIKIAEIDHVVFRCRDQRKLLELYTRLMGLVEERRID